MERAQPYRLASVPVTPVRALQSGGLVLVVAAGVVALGVALGAAHDVGLLVVAYLLTAALGEALLRHARLGLTVQFSTGLILFAIASGHGPVAPLIAIVVLAVRWPILRRTGAVAALVLALPAAAGAAWLTGHVVHDLRLDGIPDDVHLIVLTVAAAVAFVVVNVTFVSLIGACADRRLAYLRLRQHGPRLLRRHAAAGTVAATGVAICNHFLNAQAELLVFGTYLAFVLSAVLRQRRHGRTQHHLEALVRSIDWKDAYTAGHVMRVGELAMALGGELGLPGDALERLGFAARVHDLGKVTVPVELLQWNGPLDVHQRGLLEGHALGGEALLNGLVDVPEAMLVAGGHHERWDGKGYPRGLAGASIPFVARITAVADTWDAMTSDRPYRRALPEAVAWAELENGRGTQFDTAVIDAFVRLQRRAGPALGLLSPHDTAPIIQ